MKKKEPIVRVSKLRRPLIGQVEKESKGNKWHFTANYYHPKTIALLFSSTKTGSLIGFIIDGMEHLYEYKQAYTPKGLARKAFKILNEL